MDRYVCLIENDQIILFRINCLPDIFVPLTRQAEIFVGGLIVYECLSSVLPYQQLRRKPLQRLELAVLHPLDELSDEHLQAGADRPHRQSDCRGGFPFSIPGIYLHIPFHSVSFIHIPLELSDVSQLQLALPALLQHLPCHTVFRQHQFGIFICQAEGLASRRMKRFHIIQGAGDPQVVDWFGLTESNLPVKPDLPPSPENVELQVPTLCSIGGLRP